MAIHRIGADCTTALAIHAIAIMDGQALTVLLEVRSQAQRAHERTTAAHRARLCCKRSQICCLQAQGE